MLSQTNNEEVWCSQRRGAALLRSANLRKKAWLPAVSEVGLADLVVHYLRDSAASLAISSGESIKAVQRMLGHASAAMTLTLRRTL